MKRDIDQAVKEYVEELGYEHCNLGIVDMPEGFAILRDQDGMYCFITARFQSAVYWNRWHCYRVAKKASIEGGWA